MDKIISILIEDVGICEVIPRFYLKIGYTEQKSKLFKPITKKGLNPFEVKDSLETCINHKNHNLDVINTTDSDPKSSYYIICSHCAFKLTVEEVDEPFQNSYEYLL